MLHSRRNADSPMLLQCGKGWVRSVVPKMKKGSAGLPPCSEAARTSARIDWERAMSRICSKAVNSHTRAAKAAWGIK